MKKDKVSVNLVVLNGRKFLPNCLDSVFNQTYPNYEILIVDNCSSDGSAQFIKQKYPQLRLLESQVNLGFAGGHNVAIENSDGEFILCLNQDIVVHKDFLENAVAFLKKNPTIGALQPKLLRLKEQNNNFIKTDIIDTTGLLMLKNRRIIARGQGQKDEGQFDKTEEIFGVDGALPVYRREALEDVKISVNSRNRSAFDPRYEYFDEDFFAYKEDVDLAWRLRLTGWKAFYVSGAAVAWHARSAGDSTATNYLGIIRERLKIGKFAKYLSFKNQRLMQIKNEQPWLLFKHLPWFLPKEIASWIYVILFEHYTWRAIRDLFRQAPRAWQKRKIIMKRKRVGFAQMAPWFK